MERRTPVKTAEKAPERSRLSLDLNGRQTAFLGAYSERKGVTKATALRQALTLLMIREKAIEDGLTFGAFGTIDGQTVKREILLLG